MTRIAFYAPMKPPDHPTPSGDRRMARLLMQALEKAGYDTGVASELRSRDGVGNPDAQAALIREAALELERLTAHWHNDPPALWFTYHCYYKAPDLLGPALADHFGIPYVIAEASRARKRLTGPWAAFARRAESAIDRADLLLAMTEHDRSALDRDARNGQQIADFPPFIDIGPVAVSKAQSSTLRLLTVAMMRGPDKRASYRRLATALRGLDSGAWCLTIVGDGPERAEVEAMFEAYGDQVIFAGQISDEHRLQTYYAQSDVFVWPGVNEAYGMVYLEAQAAGTAVVAEDWPGPRSVIAPSSALVPKDDARAFRDAIMRLSADPEAGRAARRHVLNHHEIDGASARLKSLLGDLS